MSCVVMVVEDDRDARELLSELLGYEGHEVRAAAHGEAALALAAQTGVRPIDAVITDLHLPDMSGITLAQRLRALLPTLPCLVALSGDSPDELRAVSGDALFDHILQKPLDVDRLLATLAALPPRAPG